MASDLAGTGSTGIAELARAVQAVRGGSRAVVLIDGRSGSGKSELAARLATALGALANTPAGTRPDGRPGTQIVRLDDLYPGWDGLESGSRMVRRNILDGHRWQRWDWAAQIAAEWHYLDPHAPLIIEGCGALSRENRAAATFGIWVELDEPARKARALARDGAAYEPHWDRWAAQELTFIEREHPELLADVCLTG